MSETNKPAVLVVDDDPMLLQLVSETLAANGYDVVTAANGAEGLHRISLAYPDVVVCDVMMPGVDGYKFLQQLRGDQATRHIPVILLTSRDTTDDVVRGLTLGADDYVTKPVKLPELLARVAAKVERPSLPAEQLPIDRRTGLLSEPAFVAGLRAELVRFERGGEAGCIAQLTLEELPAITDRLTSRAINEVLLQMAKVASRDPLPMEVIARSGTSLLFFFPGAGAATVKQRMQRVGLRIHKHTFEAGGEKLRFTPVMGIAPFVVETSATLLRDHAEVAVEHSSLHLDLQPYVYDPAMDAEVARKRAEREARRKKERVAIFLELCRLPFQITLMLVGGFGIPLLIYWVCATFWIDITPVVYLLVVLALFLTSLLILVEGFLALRRIDPPPARMAAPPASAIIAAYLPNEAATILETIDAFLRLDYRAGLQIILAYNTPRDMPIEAELRAIAQRDPRFVAFRVPNSTSKAQNVNAALGIVRGEFVGVFDADHKPDANSFSRAWQWLSNGYSIVQGHCFIRNGSESWVARMIAIEFEAIYAVAHPGRARLHGYGIFGGSNGYWKTELLRETRMHGFMLTEDIDSSMRVVQNGYKIASDPYLVSRELAPVTLRALWNQRLRWAQGWFQVSLKRLWTGLRSPNMSARQKLGLFHLLAWREVYPWVSFQIVPILAFWLVQRRHLDWFVPIFVFTTVFTLSSGPLQTLFTYAVADPEMKKRKSWFWWYLAIALVFYTEFKNLIARLGQIKEFMGERAWKVTPRTAASAGR